MVKKRICVIFLVLILLATTALAGDATGVFMNDEAVVFFGKVVAYDKAVQSVTVVPTKKIKGDIELETEQTFEVYFRYSMPNRFGEFLLEADATFIMAYGKEMTYGKDWNEEENRLLHVFKVTSTDAKTAKIERSVCHDNVIAYAMQTHLNNGDYQRAEVEQLRALGQTNTPQSGTNNNFHLYIGLGGAVILLACAGVFVVKRRSKQ